MIINTNNGSAMAARILGESTNALQKSLSRLSSGSKIASPSDDAAGTAVAMRFQSQINRAQAAKSNVGNAIAFSQTQDGFLDKVGEALDRMSELAMLAQDETKSSQDLSLYQKEYNKLDEYIVNISGKDFNGISLFSGNGFTVTVAADGGRMEGSGVVLTGGYWTSVASNTQLTSAGSAAAALTELKSAISMLGGARADVGANMSRYEAESSTLSILKDNLSAARSRISDTDIAEESANYARQQILVQSGTAMLAQANVLPQSALRLIG